MTRLVDRLERDGLLERDACSDDGRGTYAVLTEKGEACLSAARRTHLDGVRERFLEHFEPDELRCSRRSGSACCRAPRISDSASTSRPATAARAPGRLKLAHGEVRTPAFVPLATKAVVKTLEVREAAELGFDMVLGNTFHLFLTPGHELIAQLGGLHRFMRWDRPIITDSGGFQVFSMGHGTVADEIKGRAAQAAAPASAPARSSRSRRRA